MTRGEKVMGVVEVVARTHHSTAGLLVKNELLNVWRRAVPNIGLVILVDDGVRVRKRLVAEKSHHIFFCRHEAHILSMGTTAGKRNAGSFLAIYPGINFLYIERPASQHMGGFLAISGASVCSNCAEPAR